MKFQRPTSNFGFSAYDPAMRDNNRIHACVAISIDVISQKLACGNRDARCPAVLTE